jgi:CRISPR system Cascade subunit CasC
MNRFLQIHLLTSYPRANLNRDDLGRPKTAIMGGANRLRVSSQSLKRAWRTSDVFQQALEGKLGTRTKRLGREIYRQLLELDTPKTKAKTWAKEIAGVFGKNKSLSTAEKKAVKELKDDDERTEKELIELDIEQLAHISPSERSAVDALTKVLAERQSGPEKQELDLLRHHNRAADIALFGRMLADSPAYNTEAAAQVAHAIGVHKSAVEDDFFTAVDDLNRGEEDLGAGHMGQTEFGAGLFYLYLCIDRELLLENLDQDQQLVDDSLRALVEAAATVAPTGKQNSFASRARASYILAETGDQQPRSLAVAFLKPTTGPDMLSNAIGALEKTRDAMDKAYGDCADQRAVLDVGKGEGTLQEIIDCATG